MDEIATPEGSEAVSILIVEDEQLLADLYTEWIDERWRVKTATTGSKALDLLDDEIDVVLLDRNLPDMDGSQVLEAIRDRDLTCRVVMVTAVEPDFDIIEMPFDGYIQKPVDRTVLLETVEEMILRRSYTAQTERFFACVSKLAALESSKSKAELMDDDRYLALKKKAEELRQETDAILDEMDRVVPVFHEIERVRDSSNGWRE